MFVGEGTAWNGTDDVQGPLYVLYIHTVQYSVYISQAVSSKLKQWEIKTKPETPTQNTNQTWSDVHPYRAHIAWAPVNAVILLQYHSCFQAA